MDSNAMQTMCKVLAAGAFSPFKTEDVFKQLRTEGKKRIDAFVFELMFKHRLKTIVSDIEGLTLSFGWHIGYNKDGDPAYWFRLMDDEGDWNRCDDEMTRRLRSCRVGANRIQTNIFRVRYVHEEKELSASEYANVTWGDWEGLGVVLERLPLRGTSRAPKPMQNQDPASAELALKWLGKPILRHELPALSLQRRFMNCYLGSLLGRDGTDLDMMALTPEGQLRYVEFKRKYPATGKQKFFGLDKWPHRNTIDILATIGVSSLHIILVGPKWNKGISPIEWLNNSSLNQYWTWLAINLDGDAFDRIASLHTSGPDSGQRAASRDQEAIKWDRIQLLHEGITLGEAGGKRMVEFLISGKLGNQPLISFEELLKRQAK